MGWLRGMLHPSRQTRDDLERQAADELRALTADARPPFRPEPEPGDLEPDGGRWDESLPSLDAHPTAPAAGGAKRPRRPAGAAPRRNGSQGPRSRGRQAQPPPG